MNSKYLPKNSVSLVVSLDGIKKKPSVALKQQNKTVK